MKKLVLLLLIGAMSSTPLLANKHTHKNQSTFVTVPMSSVNWEAPSNAWDVVKDVLFSVKPTKHGDIDNNLRTIDWYDDIDLRTNISYTKKRNADKSQWNHARGFGLIYTNPRSGKFVKLRYFPDVKQLSLYINDKQGFNEYIVKDVRLKPNTWHNVRFKIVNNRITCKINGEPFFKQVPTDMNFGQFELMSSNNHTDFFIRKFTGKQHYPKPKRR